MADKPVNPILPDTAHRLRADQVSIEEYRANPTKYTFPITPGPSPEVGDATIYTIKVDQPPGEIQVQVYTPIDDAIQAGGLKTNAGLPAHVNYHGGGWVIGTLLSDASWCRQACQTVGLIVIDVAYRLAPEYPFPTQIHDSFTALQWVFSNAQRLGIDPSRVSIGGTSAGGHIAAVLAILARDARMPALKLQLLVVPAVDARWIPLEGSCDPAKVPYKSYVECEYAPCLPLQRMRWFSRLWLGTDPESFLASPILAASHANLAPASIRCAEFDMLCDEGRAYNGVLNNAGTSSRIKVYAGVCHPFGHWDGELEKAKEYVRDTFDDLRKAHSVSKPRAY